MNRAGRRVEALWLTRAQGRAPRAALLLACSILSVAGIRAIFAPPATLEASRPQSPALHDLAAQAFAADFARAYLEWDPANPAAHERAMARFVGGTQALDVARTGHPEIAQRVERTIPVGDVGSRRRRQITIAAETSRGRVHLAVPVERDENGLLFLAGAPAIVGPPPASRHPRSRPETEVEDRQLRALAARVVRNFLSGEREDLAADLHPDAVVSLPEMPLRVRSTDAITWSSASRRVAVQVTAASRRAPRMALRYELSVLRVGGRWVVRTIHTNPIALEGDR